MVIVQIVEEVIEGSIERGIQQECRITVEIGNRAIVCRAMQNANVTM